MPPCAIILDTETTGLFGGFCPPPPGQWKSYPCVRIVELGFRIINLDNPRDVVDDVHLLIKDESVDPEANYAKRAFEVHQITRQLVNTYGVSFETMFDRLRYYDDDIRYVVGYNTNFDMTLLHMEYLRLQGGDPPLKIFDCPRIDLMRETPPLFGLGVQWWKLTELYAKLYGESHPDPHRTRGDVDMTHLLLLKTIEHLGPVDNVFDLLEGRNKK